jgi:hypothetical protein
VGKKFEEIPKWADRLNDLYANEEVHLLEQSLTLYGNCHFPACQISRYTLSNLVQRQACASVT